MQVSRHAYSSQYPCSSADRISWVLRCSSPVFLDLPAPWEAVASAKAAMRVSLASASLVAATLRDRCPLTGSVRHSTLVLLQTDVATRICCFSPCIEQVLRTVTALSNEGFSGTSGPNTSTGPTLHPPSLADALDLHPSLPTDISMSETLLRQHEILLNIPLPPIGSVIDKLNAQEVRKEARRLAQIASHKASSTSTTLDADASSSSKRKDPPSPSASGASTPTNEKTGPRRKGDPVPFGTVLGRPMVDARGHTSYLTFATLLPVGLRGGKEGVVEADEMAPAEAVGVVGSEKDKTGEVDEMDEGGEELDAAIAEMTEEVSLA